MLLGCITSYAELIENVPEFNISQRTVFDNQPCFIIAEICQNYNINVNIARKMTVVCAKARVDCELVQERLYKKCFDRPHVTTQGRTLHTGPKNCTRSFQMSSTWN